MKVLKIISRFEKHLKMDAHTNKLNVGEDIEITENDHLLKHITIKVKLMTVIKEEILTLWMVKLIICLCIEMYFP